jgi:hypothetical protein
MTEWYYVWALFFICIGKICTIHVGKAKILMFISEDHLHDRELSMNERPDHSTIVTYRW